MKSIKTKFLIKRFLNKNKKRILTITSFLTLLSYINRH